MPHQTANKPMRSKIMNNSNMKQKKMKEKGRKNHKKTNKIHNITKAQIDKINESHYK